MDKNRKKRMRVATLLVLLAGAAVNLALGRTGLGLIFLGVAMILGLGVWRLGSRRDDD